MTKTPNGEAAPAHERSADQAWYEKHLERADKQISGATGFVEKVKRYKTGAAVVSILSLPLIWFGGTALDRFVKPYVVGVFGKDQVDQLREEQQKAFEDLKAKLDSIRTTSSGPAQKSIDEAFATLRTLGSANARLVSELEAARREMKSLSAIAERKAGISGGFDFALTPGSGIRIDETTQLGIGFIGYGATEVRLTSADRKESMVAKLGSGQSLSYTSAAGKPCRIVLLGMSGDGANASATFAKSCTT